jgi:hypothetical protein
MAFGNFTNLFSRHFLIGFLAAPLAGLFVLSQFLSKSWLPRGYLEASSATQAVIVGATAVFIALLLSGLQYPIVRVLEGYPLRGKRVAAKWYRWGVRRWQKRFDELEECKLAPMPSPERTEAARRLSERFPARRENVLPTEFGNVLRAFETHPRNRYGLDGIAIWPRIHLLLGAEERELVEEAATSMQFFVNSLVTTLLVGSVLAVGSLFHQNSGWGTVGSVLGIVLGMVATAEGFRRGAVNAAQRWGTPVRAAMDLHRLELYERLGVRRPETQEEELTVARAVNRLLTFGEPMPDSYRTTNEDEGVLDGGRSKTAVSRR